MEKSQKSRETVVSLLQSD